MILHVLSVLSVLVAGWALGIGAAMALVVDRYDLAAGVGGIVAVVAWAAGPWILVTFFIATILGVMQMSPEDVHEKVSVAISENVDDYA